MNTNAKERFSDRATQYVKYRPSYPVEILSWLESRRILQPSTIIADIGSGTGKLSELFVTAGFQVTGVEPNDAMRAAADELLAGRRNFSSVKASAEATTLETNSIDLITAGQAFHWFDPESARREFERVLKPGGAVMLVWNSWDANDSLLAQDYSEVVRTFALDYDKTSRTNLSGEDILSFFAPATGEVVQSKNPQQLDLEGLVGRATSSSYMPTPVHPSYPELEKALTHLFSQHADNNVVTFNYTTQVYLGKL